jgi:hypothetical protein
MRTDDSRRLWLLPHERFMLSRSNPLKERRYSGNPSRQETLQKHGVAGFLTLASAMVDGLLGGVLVLVGAVLLLLRHEISGYLVILLGVAHGVLALVRVLQSARMRPKDIPTWVPLRR